MPDCLVLLAGVAIEDVSSLGFISISIAGHFAAGRDTCRIIHPAVVKFFPQSVGREGEVHRADLEGSGRFLVADAVTGGAAKAIHANQLFPDLCKRGIDIDLFWFTRLEAMDA